MFKRAVSELQTNIGNSFKVGLFFVAMGLLVALLAMNSTWVARFRATAMSFVPAEAVSFFMVPDLESFMTDGSSSFLAIASNLASNQSDSDFISLLMPQPKLKEQSLPTQCRTLRDLSDLQKSGLEPQSSFSIARLDSGSRVAVKTRDDAKTLAFLSDVLFPAYIRIGTTREITHPEKEGAKKLTPPNAWRK